jgi:2-oxoglutarate dehydrogenase E1 component
MAFRGGGGGGGGGGGARTCTSSSRSFLSSNTTIHRGFSTAALQEQEDEETQQQLHESETFLTGTSSIYAEEMYERYLNDPTSVEASWKKYFDDMQNGIPYDASAYNSPTISPATGNNILKSMGVPAPHLAGLPSNMTTDEALAPSDSLGVAHLIRAYQVNGHLAAKLDPLDLHTKEAFPYRPSNLLDPSKLSTDGGYPPELTIEFHGFTSADLDRRLYFKGRSSGGNKGYLEELANAPPEKVTLRLILAELRKTYCSTLAVEYMHIGDHDKMNWIRYVFFVYRV